MKSKRCLTKRNKEGHFYWEKSWSNIKCLRERAAAINTSEVMASAEGIYCKKKRKKTRTVKTVAL